MNFFAAYKGMLSKPINLPPLGPNGPTLVMMALKKNPKDSQYLHQGDIAILMACVHNPHHVDPRNPKKGFSCCPDCWESFPKGSVCEQCKEKGLTFDHEKWVCSLDRGGRLLLYKWLVDHCVMADRSRLQAGDHSKHN